MLQVSERAREELKKALEAAGHEPGEGLRLTVTGPEQLGLGVDSERPGDDVYEHEGTKVLMVDKDIAELVQDLSLDVAETEDGPQLTMSSTDGGDIEDQSV